MTTTTTVQRSTTRGSVRADAVVGVAAGVAAVGLWSFWTQVAEVELVARQGQGTATVGLASVVVTAVMASGLGIGLLRLLEARTANALRTWTIAASVVFAVSLLGPLGATTVAAGLALLSLHLAMAAVLVVGLRQLRRQQPAAGVA